MNLVRRDDLLADVAIGLSRILRENPMVPIGCITVRFVVRGVTKGITKYEFGLDAALDALANDLYWDERGNWATATKAEVTVD